MITLEKYESEIITLQNAICDYPDSTSLKSKLSSRLTAWSKRLDISVFVASNEQDPWTTEELGLPCVPMATKKQSGFDQVGDYHVYIHNKGIFTGLVVERKGVKRTKGLMTACDMYSTFANRPGRERFYAEIARFKQDSRFNQMLIISECTYQEFLSFKPMFNGKSYNRTNHGMSVEARRGTIAGLYAKDIPVVWAGTRLQATRLYEPLVRQWCRHNFNTVVK